MRRRVPWRSSVSAKFSDRRRVSGSDGRRHAFSVSAPELVADRSELALLKFADGDPAPPLGGPDDGGIHQLQHRALAERVWDDLRPAALLEKESLQQVRGAHDAAMPEREAQVGDARVEVVTETLHHRRQLALVRLDEVVPQHRGEGWRRRLVTAARPQRDLWPPALRGFAPEIAEPMHEAALAQRPREARLDGADQSRRPVGNDQQRVGQPPALEILEEGRAARRVLLRARRQMQQDLLAVVGNAPGTEHRLPRQAGVQPLGHAVDEQVGDREFAEIPPGEGFVLLPQPLGHLADRRATQDAGPARIAERRFDVPCAQPAREHLHRQALELRRAARQAGPHAGDKRLDAIGDLRDPILDGPLRTGEPAAPIAIAVAGAGRRPVLVVAAAHGVGDLRFQGFLHDLTYRELEELGASIAVSDALAQQLIKLLARPLRCRYSRRHGDASSCRRCHPATLVWIPSKSASPSRYPASLGLHLQHRIIASQGEDSILKRAIGSDWKGKLSPLLYVAAIVLAFVSPWLAVSIYVLA